MADEESGRISVIKDTSSCDIYFLYSTNFGSPKFHRKGDGVSGAIQGIDVAYILAYIFFIVARLDVSVEDEAGVAISSGHLMDAINARQTRQEELRVVALELVVDLDFPEMQQNRIGNLLLS